jgi:calcium binding protein 39
MHVCIYRYEHQDIALNCGTMLRECARYEALAKIILNTDYFYKFFEFVEVSTFDIASDAFSTFKVWELEVLMICAQELKKQKTNVYLILISRNC